MLIVAAAALGPAAATCAQSGVDVEIENFGLGIFRPGGIVPMRVKLTSNLAEPTGVWVQWQVPNGDGDIGEYGRSLTLSPGQSNSTWLYAPLGPTDNAGTVWTVRVFEEKDGERRGELGGLRFDPTMPGSQQVDIAAGMIAVLGDRRLGLDDYSAQNAFRVPRPLSGHEDTRIVSGLKAADIPDRWYGLMAFEAIAWAGDTAQPLDLTIDQADAIREYVQRGGHLIISLPSAGNQWGLGAPGQTQLEDLLPCRTSGVVPRRDEGVPLSDLLPIMCKSQNVRLLIGSRSEPQLNIRVFKDLHAGENAFNVIDNGYEPLLALNDGRVVTVQKRFGFGRVTVVGVDLSDGRLASVGLPQADVFWSRILGRRADTPTLTELQAAEKAEYLARSLNDTDRNMGSGMLFSSGISMQTTAGVGLLLAFLLFVAYWAVGLASFFVLRQYKLSRHAWVAFAAIAGGFTLIAWGSVGLIPKSQDIQHVTVLDHIARPADSTSTEEQYQRALSFFSLYLPRYGATEVKVQPAGDLRDLLLSWTPPGDNIAPFPNTDVFRVDVARNFATTRLPSRSTTTQMQVNWLGGVDSQWGGMLRSDPNNPVRVVKNAAGAEESLAGAIINELPGRLVDPVVIWVKNGRIGNRRYMRDVNPDQSITEREWVTLLQSGTMANVGEMVIVPATFDWGTGPRFDLATQWSERSQRSSLAVSIRSRFIEPYENNSLLATPDSQRVTAEDQRRFLMMLSMFHQLDPPTYLKNPRDSTMDRSTTTFHREIARELDLSPWFTRPCVIVMGFLEGVPSPVPLRVDGHDLPPSSTGLTLVRWIYPLPLDENIAFPPPSSATEEAE